MPINVINSLPSYNFSKAGIAHLKPEQYEDNKDRIECSVCTIEYEEGEQLVTLPCFHTYHFDCVTSWFKK